MKIIVMGTGPFAVPTFEWLLESEHEIPMLVTRPIEDPGKRRKSQANPMREFAEQAGGLEILDPANVNDERSLAALREVQADLLMVCDFGQLLSRDALTTTRLGGINLHGSLLPKYRGAAPINWSVYNGDTETGVTVIHMTPRLDGGPMLVQRTIAIGADETAEQLEPRMSALGVSAVADAIAMLDSWNGVDEIGTIQDQSLATRAPRLNKQQGNLDWSRTARELFNQIRAFQPWPGSFTHWVSADSDAANNPPLRLIVQRAEVVDASVTVSQGTVQSVTESTIIVATAGGLLGLLEVQPAGKRTMTVTEFLRGRSVKTGDTFESQ